MDKFNVGEEGGYALDISEFPGGENGQESKHKTTFTWSRVQKFLLTGNRNRVVPITSNLASNTTVRLATYSVHQVSQHLDRVYTLLHGV